MSITKEYIYFTRIVYFSVIPAVPRKSSNFLKDQLPTQTMVAPLATDRCEFSCALNCPFGYKLNYNTNCPKCECSPLKMTECGVPCFPAGTKNCAFAMRANSRPNCECQDSYQGTYCHVYTKSANYTVEFVQPLILNKSIIDEIRM